jgi:hypothetical protein
MRVGICGRQVRQKQSIEQYEQQASKNYRRKTTYGIFLHLLQQLLILLVRLNDNSLSRLGLCGLVTAPPECRVVAWRFGGLYSLRGGVGCLGRDGGRGSSSACAGDSEEGGVGHFGFGLRCSRDVRSFEIAGGGNMGRNE